MGRLLFRTPWLQNSSLLWRQGQKRPRMGPAAGLPLPMRLSTSPSHILLGRLSPASAALFFPATAIGGLVAGTRGQGGSAAVLSPFQCGSVSLSLESLDGSLPSVPFQYPVKWLGRELLVCQTERMLGSEMTPESRIPTFPFSHPDYRTPLTQSCE